MSNPASVILYSTQNPDTIRERLNFLVSNRAQVAIRIESPVSPITLHGVIGRLDGGEFIVDSSDQISYAKFTLEQVSSMGSYCIWITP